MTALCVRFAGERSSQPGLAVHIGTIAPIVYAASIWTMNQATGWLIAVRKHGEWAVIHRCRICGKLSSNRIAADDNPMKLMSLAMKPVVLPPFPLEKVEEMTRLMGGEGALK